MSPLASTDGVFHAGELRAQALAGVSASGAAIREFMPEQHRTFFAALPFLLLASTDDDGWPVATLLAGAPGFVSSPDQRSLRIEAAAGAPDPVRALLRPGRPVGLLGIDFSSRRRNRANGIVSDADADADALDIAVTQSFGNCSKYIQPRAVRVTPASARPAAAVGALAGLDGQARALISTADTFFVATSSGQAGGRPGGADMSHRGGAPGFVRLAGDTLVCPDYAGNRYFNTLGNMLLEPRAALLFIDFSNGDLLHLQGRSEIVWRTEDHQDFPGAERLWRFHVERGWRSAGPLRAE